MAFVGSIETKIGWQLDEIVVVQDPTFEHDPDADFVAFDWFNAEDAQRLCDCVSERLLAAGKAPDDWNIPSPVAGDTDASLASTFAALQKPFVGDDSFDVDEEWPFLSVVSPIYNTQANKYKSWAERYASGDGVLGDLDGLFKQFCIEAGLKDGSGNYGFRYVQKEEDGSLTVVYPNSRRMVQSGDIMYYPDEPDIYLTDLLKACEAIKHINWEGPGEIASFGGQEFTWSNQSIATGEGSSITDYDPSIGWTGDPADPFQDAKDDFEETSDTPDTFSDPGAFANTKSSLYINSDSTELRVELTSEIGKADVSFTPALGGQYTVYIKTAAVSGGDFDALGSGLTSAGWVSTSGSATAGTEETAVIFGSTSMEVGDFVSPLVPSAQIRITLDPASSSIELNEGDTYYWSVSATLEVFDVDSSAYESVSGNFNPNLTTEWTGDLSETVGDKYTGEAIDLNGSEEGEEYAGTFVATYWPSSPSTLSENATADLTLTAVATTSEPDTTTTAPETTLPPETTFY